MDTHETNIGEGDAPVTCHYSFDSEGDLDALQVIFFGVDIKDALTDQQLGELEDECRIAAKVNYDETKDDTAIDNYIERTTA